MKYLILLLPILLLSCNSGEGEENEGENGKDLQEESFEFDSDIRPEYEAWDYTEVYTDTLTFIGFDDNYDYWYANFKTDGGNEVSLVYDDFIDSELKGSVMAVRWVIDSLYEAGEGDEPYLQERMESFKILEKSLTIRDWLYGGPIDDLLKNDLAEIDQYVHPEQDGIHLSYNPGAYCVLGGGGYLPDFAPEFGDGYSVILGAPEGDFCEGYEGVENGFYITTIESELDLPKYFDMSGSDDDWTTESPFVPMGGADEYFKIYIVTEEYHYAYLYVIKIYDEYYLWLIDYCDCSA